MKENDPYERSEALMNDEHLVAVCGLYCGACAIYRAWNDGNQERLQDLYNRMSARRDMVWDDLQCNGCLSNGKLLPFCRDCNIRLCALEKPGVTRCSDCDDFPCTLITEFNNDGMRHHSEVLDNLRRLSDMGINTWLEEEEKRWRCPQCRAPVEWYAQTCLQCGSSQPQRLTCQPEDRSL
jgi:hypothetical protein